MTDQPDMPTELLERVQAIIEDIAPACVDCSAHVVSNRKSAMERFLRAVAPMLIEHGRKLEKAQGETLESMIAWGDQTFGPCTQQRAIERAGEEWDEMEQPDADVPVEAADVIICLLRIPGIREAINRKMAINRERTWSVRSDGTGYHVKNVEHRSKP